MARRSFGMLDKLPSGNWRARYTGPDKKRYQAPTTFPTKAPAQAWLAARQTEIALGTWRPPAEVEAEQAAARAAAAQKQVTLGTFAERWLATRTNSKGQPLRPRTREEYQRLLRATGTRDEDDPGGPLAELLELPLSAITPERVRTWRAAQLALGTATQTSRAYALLKSIMATALGDKLIDEQPCTIRGGSHTSTGQKVLPPTDQELAVLLTTIQPRYRALVILGAIGGLRWGEATALRAQDVAVERDQAGGVVAVRVHVSQAVTWTQDGPVVGPTKSEAGQRVVTIFGSDAQIIAEHVADRIGQALLFPATSGGHLHATTFHRHWKKARTAAGREDLRFHALRHYAGTSYAQAGATLRETMARLGHSTTTAAMRYQHAGSRDDELAMRLAKRTTA